jgi:ABC-2 type transport system permease protein
MTTTVSARALDTETGIGAVGEVISSVARPPRPSALANAFTFGWRAVLKIKHLPEQLFDVTIFPLLFTLMFTYLFGGALAGSTSEYLKFLLPGILVQTTVFITMYTGLTLATDIDKGMFDRFKSLPIWQPSPIVGAMLGDVVRFGIACTMVLGLGFGLGYRTQGGGILGVAASVLLILLFCFAISWIWILVGLTVRSPQAVMSISMMVLFPLTFASNTYVDPKTMPNWLESFINVNPLSHATSACRGFMAGDIKTNSLIIVLAVAAGLIAIFGPLAMRRYHRRV